MTRREIAPVAWSIVASLVICSGFYWFNNRQMKKTAVVDAVRLFNEYKMKNELEGRSKVRLSAIGARMDSLEQAFKVVKMTKDEDEQRTVIEQYGRVKSALDQEFAKSNQEINEAVWKRLNPLLTQYGKEHDLHIIIGANGMGSILYYDQYYDLTEDVVSYVNKKYENE